MLTGTRTEAESTGRDWNAYPPKDLAETRTLMVDILCRAAERFTERYGIPIQVQRCGQNFAVMVYPWGDEEIFELEVGYVN